MRILKFQLAVTDTQLVEMYRECVILDIQSQDDELYIWAMCDETEPKKNYEFRIFGTGHTLPDTYNFRDKTDYIKTVQTNNGALVWHIFRVVDP